ncbi:EAL domain-containing protein [Oceanimonas pelagia]|uniref:cyclic-guanylate-specific phosphodiesterase n=1 Tax=Oceanimonas pelagia TaxID=3028314 RepID=A0AA50KL79_9GAMM|nr:EAL domain-containing protein [Oceanimonas pelagia]WMC10186.1 EAL domain-containing protein [Oceanimonas pelagia]
MLVPLLLLQAAILIGTSYLLYRDYIRDQMEIHAWDSVTQVANKFSGMVAILVADTSIFARNPVLNRYLKTDENIRAHVMYSVLHDEFQSFLTAYPDYRELTLLLPDGDEEISLRSDGTASIPRNRQSRPYFQQMVNQNLEVLTTVQREPDSGEWVLLSIRRLLHFDPIERTRQTEARVSGYLVLKSVLRPLAQQMANNRLFSQGFSLLHNAEGSQLLSEGHTRLSATGLGALVQALSGTAQGRISYTEDVLLDDDCYLVGQTELLPGLYFSVGWPESGLKQLLLEMGISAGRVTLLVMLVTMVVLFWLLNRMLIRPIMRLGHAAERLGKGEEDWHLPCSGRDELSALGGTVRDMGQALLRQRQALHDIAYRDSLTRLPNRRRFLEILESHYDAATGAPPAIALMFLDLDEFKHINDTLGHETGDVVLVEVARRMEQLLRGSDVIGHDGAGSASGTLARLGGDEFTLLLTDIGEREQAVAVAERLLAAFSRPLMVAGKPMLIGISMGVALARETGDSASELLKNADVAMYDAKQHGKNTYRFFCPDAALASLKQLELRDDLHRAIYQKQLRLVYQPQVDARSGRLAGCEALVRWKHPEKGWIPPNVFIPIAEQAGLIVPLGRWVMLEACRQITLWQSMGYEVPRVSVNVSFVQLLREDLHQVLLSCLAANQLGPDRISVEVTESCIMQGVDAIDQLKRIQKSGIRVALDDFGTGYSSLSALKGLPIDELKIDRSFISEIAEGDDARAIVAAIIAMAQRLGVEVVAEGVENEVELNYLRERGADIIQGYFFGRPVPGSEFTGWLADTASHAGEHAVAI